MIRVFRHHIQFGTLIEVGADILMCFLAVLLAVSFQTFPSESALPQISLTGLLLPAAALHAQNYPARPVRMIIPFTAGSASDIIARAMEPALRERLGQPLVIDNRGGGGGTIATDIVADDRGENFVAGHAGFKGAYG